jgi:thiamine kinase-like enzyme/choline kinase/predicted transcriptional regulator
MVLEMGKKLQILYEINSRGFGSQRLLAERTGISVGLVNRLLKELCENGMLKRQERKYTVTDAGAVLLEKEWKQRQEQKLSAEEESAGVKEAVILAAGGNRAFDRPVGLLELDSLPIVEFLLRELTELGITRICVVAGSQAELFEEYLQGRDIALVENKRWRWTGTMASLACAAQYLSGDFLVVESNQILERAGIENVLHAPSSNACLLVNPSGSADEAYVELDEEGNIFRISKDIRQMNRVDGELVGVAKISRKLFGRMMEYYEKNENPLLNYEYVLENIGRIYKIPVVREDDLQWTVIENQKHYQRARNLVYPKIQKKNRLRKENMAKEIFSESTGILEEEILEFRVCGGMTNTNFYVKTKTGAYILRVPGAGTTVMIDRYMEGQNARLGEKLGINVPTLYFNEETGVKITSYVEHAETLNAMTAQWESNMKKTAGILRTLHGSGLVMENSFSVQKEYEKYKEQIQAAGGGFYPGFEEMDRFFDHLMERLELLGLEKAPCHNDLVPENLIKDSRGRMYLIDWEYAGSNDPMWDLASHLLECEFTEETKQLFLEQYFQGEIPGEAREKILIFEICQDILWSAWTRLKEQKGEDFGTYGTDRLQRAARRKKEYEERYEKDGK